MSIFFGKDADLSSISSGPSAISDKSVSSSVWLLNSGRFQWLVVMTGSFQSGATVDWLISVAGHHRLAESIDGSSLIGLFHWWVITDWFISMVDGHPLLAHFSGGSSLIGSIQ